MHSADLRKLVSTAFFFPVESDRWRQQKSCIPFQKVYSFRKRNQHNELNIIYYQSASVEESNLPCLSVRLKLSCLKLGTLGTSRIGQIYCIGNIQPFSRFLLIFYIKYLFNYALISKEVKTKILILKK